MLLEIRDINQNSFKVCVKRSDRIIEVKDKIKSKIEALDTGEQKLVYLGHILSNESTVEECELDSRDYVTLIYSQLKKHEVCELVKRTLDVDKKSGANGSWNAALSNETSNSLDAGSMNTSEDIFASTMSDDEVDDSEAEDLSRITLLESLPDAKKVCTVIGNNPVKLPKVLSKLTHRDPLVLQKIIQNQHAYIELLNTDHTDEHIDVEDGNLGAKYHKAIDRLIKKGYEKEMALKVYQACGLNEDGAAELLLALTT